MDTNHKSSLSYLLRLSLFIGLISLTACSSRLEASVNGAATAVPLPTRVDAEMPVEETTAEVPEASDEPGQYTNDTYQLAFDLMKGWNLAEYPLGDGINGHPLSQVVELSKDGYHMLVHIKYWWDPTVIGGGLGLGEVVSNGSASLLNWMVPRRQLVYDSLTKQVWWGERFDDLELYVRLEDASGRAWEQIDIPQQVISEAESFLGTFSRTGTPVNPPGDLDMSPTPTVVPVATTCDLSPRMRVNGWAQVTPGLPNSVRSAPGRGAGSEVLGEIQSGRSVRVLDGPVCADGYNWWQVDAGLFTGWTPEGSSGTYWLVPLAEGSSTPVDGWVGTLVSAPDMPQVDDYFQMLDQGGSRYGIHSLNPDLRQQLEATRDTGTLVRIWGTLYYERMDAYNTQIEVTQFEMYTP